MARMPRSSEAGKASAMMVLTRRPRWVERIAEIALSEVRHVDQVLLDQRLIEAVMRAQPRPDLGGDPRAGEGVAGDQAQQEEGDRREDEDRDERDQQAAEDVASMRRALRAARRARAAAGSRLSLLDVGVDVVDVDAEDREQEVLHPGLHRDRRPCSGRSGTEGPMSANSASASPRISARLTGRSRRWRGRGCASNSAFSKVAPMSFDERDPVAHVGEGVVEVRAPAGDRHVEAERGLEQDVPELGAGHLLELDLEARALGQHAERT